MLNVITACIRPQNLQKIHDSIVTAKEAYKQPIEIAWHIVLDGLYRNEILEDLVFALKLPFETEILTHLHVNDTYQVKMDSPINVALSNIETGLVTIIDDDNIMHPDLIKVIYPHYLRGIKGFVYHQQLSKNSKNYNNRVRFIRVSNIGPGKTDTAQFCFDRSIIDVPWGWQTPQPDGAFIRSIFHRHRKDILVVEEILSYYNYLDPKCRF